MASHRDGELPIPEDRLFQKREWAFERFGWAAMLLTITSGALGLLGPGLLSRTRVTAEDGTAVVEYDRCLRNGMAANLRIVVAGKGLSGNKVRVAFEHVYLNRIRIVSAQPAPLHSEAGATGTEFMFQVTPGTPSAVLTLSLMPQSPGPAEGMLRVNGKAVGTLQQIVFP